MNNLGSSHSRKKRLYLCRFRLCVRLSAFRSTRNSAVPIGRIETFYENLRSAVFRFVTQRVVVILCRRFGTTFPFHLQASRNLISSSIRSDFAWFQASPAKQMRCGTIMQRVAAIAYRPFQSIYRSHLQGPRNPKREICWEKLLRNCKYCWYCTTISDKFH